MTLLKCSMTVVCLLFICVSNPAMGSISINEWNYISYSASFTPYYVGVDPYTNALQITFSSNPLDIQTIIYAIDFYKNIQRGCPNINGCQYFMTNAYGTIIGTMTTSRIWYNELMWLPNGFATTESYTIFVQKTLSTFQQYGQPNNPYLQTNPTTSGSAADEKYIADLQNDITKIQEERKKACEERNERKRAEWAISGTFYIPEVCVFVPISRLW